MKRGLAPWAGPGPHIWALGPFGPRAQGIARPGHVITRPGHAITRPGHAITRPGHAITRPGRAKARPGNGWAGGLLHRAMGGVPPCRVFGDLA